MPTLNYEVLIIGAGPAGLTAGYLLSQCAYSSIIIESHDQVGGISRTPHYKNFYFDIGGHRFFSKSDTIEKLWDEMLPNQLLTRPRQSRIYYQKKFYRYPLKPWNALMQLGFFESLLCFFSYGIAKIKPRRPAKTFADWVTHHFGKRLYLHFFKTYTEKVWGMSCEEISADWAAQRIQGLSLFQTLKNALIPRKNIVYKTLITTFRYPPRGPGMLWESCAEKYEKQGGKLIKNASVKYCEYQSHHQLWKILIEKRNGGEDVIFCRHVISSAPIRHLICDYLNPKPNLACFQAAQQLRYRDFLIVVLILKERNLFQDNWIYIHDPDVMVGRIQNFKSWSPDMVPDPALCSYGMEYFCNEGDALWNASDAELIKIATREIATIGLAQETDVIDGCVVRQLKAYPVYDQHYRAHLKIIEENLKRDYPNLHLVGRNGLHKYNNQDHSMMTAILTVKNIMARQMLHNTWEINQDDDYHESSANNIFDVRLGLREVPGKVK